MVALLTLVPLSLGLSTDAFAASLARGGKERSAHVFKALKSGAVFGSAEGLMCLGGWLAASLFAVQIQAVDHWIALILLVFIGIKMIREGLDQDEDEDDEGKSGNWVDTIVTAIGTSIDSAAVGIALALSGVTVWAALAIGLTSFAASTIGFLIGPMVAARIGKMAEIAGGVILILIGISIWVSHMTGNG